jgi:putative membrane protein
MAGERNPAEPVETAPPRKPINPNLARDHLANERTLLAWVRTAVTIMTLGFVVARFALLLREEPAPVPGRFPTGISTIFGTILALGGGVLMVLATARYWAAGKDIEQNVFHWSPLPLLIVAFAVGLVAVVLALYLLLTA